MILPRVTEHVRQRREQGGRHAHTHTPQDCWKEKEQGGTDIQERKTEESLWLAQTVGTQVTTYLQLSSITASTVACTEGTDAGWA